MELAGPSAVGWAPYVAASPTPGRPVARTSQKGASAGVTNAARVLPCLEDALSRRWADLQDATRRSFTPAQKFDEKKGFQCNAYAHADCMRGPASRRRSREVVFFAEERPQHWGVGCKWAPMRKAA
ncbi:hypothetical protein B0H15DRAFT_942441 [Mycena belliarum]|uniref:Uncharacterized protein n=1 Tax=Mycena belliarum TaxID=1033014 RepID=A0AAD6XYH9_9AGAR|nr:hypothetical protein B0H15DRAFT_942441 [Mycena belliae]